MKILVAEDDDINRELIKEVLLSEGYEVIAVSDGQDMIEIALQFKPDLIITDIQMPNMSGDTTIAMIREYDDLVKVPVIVMTGLSKVEYDRLGIPKDVNVIFKPVDTFKLIDTVKKILKV